MQQEPKSPLEQAKDLLSLLVPNWRPTTQQGLWAIRIVLGIGVMLGILTLVGQPFGITLWDWLDLLIVPVVLAIGGYLFTRTENRATQAVAERRAQDEALQSYLDQMSGMLIPNKDQPSLYKARPGDSLSSVARARTLTVLSRLDLDRKARVVQFLYEASLITKDRPVVDLAGANFENANLKNANLNGADLSGANFENANLKNANLNGADLSGASLHHAQLEEADISEAILFKTDLSEANLSEALLSAAFLIRADLRSTYLGGAILRPTYRNQGDEADEDDGGESAALIAAILYHADLRKANLSGANLSRTRLESANLKNAKLSGADLSGANLHQAQLEEANLSGANLSGADLKHAQLEEANLSGTDLSEANLSGANLKHADLSETILTIYSDEVRIDIEPRQVVSRDELRWGWVINLSDPDRRQAYLSKHGGRKEDLSEGTLRTNLSGANLHFAQLQHANLSEAQGWTDNQLGAAYSLEGATMPDGQKYEAWPLRSFKDKHGKEDVGEDG